MTPSALPCSFSLDIFEATLEMAGAAIEFRCHDGRQSREAGQAAENRARIRMAKKADVIIKQPTIVKEFSTIY